MLHFLEALKQFGNAEGWHIRVLLGEDSVYMTFSGLTLDQGYIVVGNIYHDIEVAKERDNLMPADLGIMSK
jgi:hypothetical protein